MVVFKKVKDIAVFLAEKKASGAQIGFIPTMGALHQGHISLLNRAAADGVRSVCSIFLNPTQFNNPEDLKKYPVSTDKDIELLLNAGCEVLFLPDESEIYPYGYTGGTSYDFGYLETILEGAKRPGHFKGVGQVVGKLLEIVRPDKLYLGQKDFQQCCIIANLVAQMAAAGHDFAKSLDIVRCPTVREADGLAMSSRNRRLTEPSRVLATTIYQCLISIQTKQFTDKFGKVKKECEDLLVSKGFDVEYVALADTNLKLMEDYADNVPMVALIAAAIGNIRLIDNMLL